MKPIRLTIVQTHPVQYLAPWFRYVAANCPELDVTVLYASRPRPEQQGTGFNHAFEWDTPLYDGYRWTLVRESVPGDDFATGSYRGLDVKDIGDALAATSPDVVLIPGWHSVTLTRAILWARLRSIPVIYRGDTNVQTAPSGWRRLLWHAKTFALLASYSAFLSVGRRSREFLTSHGARRTRVFSSPHAVDNACFAACADAHLDSAARRTARARIGASPHDFVVLFAGKLESRKRPIDAVRAVAALGADAMLAVAGTGPLEHDVRSEASRLGVRLAMLGFVNQSQLGEVYAAADCLTLPSASNETWGLVVNEAMSTGLPAVVSDHVGCGPDLVVRGETGETHRTGDVGELAAALASVRAAGARTSMGDACRARANLYGFGAAATGLVAACQAVMPDDAQPARVVACCGGMVMVSGLERMTFEVLRVVRSNGGTVHCIVNDWQNERIVGLAERIGASWSTGFYWYPFTSRPRSVLLALQMTWDVVRTSVGLAAVSFRFRPTHVLTPEHLAVIRNAPTLAALRLLGVKIVFRLAMAPERGRVQELLWRYALPPFVTKFVPNSRFSYRRLTETGVPAGRIALIRNAVSRRPPSTDADGDIVSLASARRTILVVGQIAPFKGTHLAIDAVLELLEQGVDVQAIVLGDVPTWPPELVEYTDRMRERICARGADHRVHFVGPRENVLEIMKASYVLAAPILQEETFGNVVLEARDVGLPVVTFARGGLPELVDHGHTGFVCPTADLDGLLVGLRYFLSSPDRRAAASANSLAAACALGNDCTPPEFERRWWAIFSPDRALHA
nr:D-inositol-3-phosphate glycosyltransferase [uncultured bacterium]